VSVRRYNKTCIPGSYFTLGACFQKNNMYPALALSTKTTITSPRLAPELNFILSYGMMFSRLISIQTLCIKLGRRHVRYMNIASTTHFIIPELGEPRRAVLVVEGCDITGPPKQASGKIIFLQVFFSHRAT
jgi:hypothetical protein